MRVFMLGVVGMCGLIILCISIFNMGRRWEAYCIKVSLQTTGTAVAQWGDTLKVKITGTAQEF